MDFLKKFGVGLLLMLFISSIGLQFMPNKAYAAANNADDLGRRRLAYLEECLNTRIFDFNDDLTSATDIINDGTASDEVVVVGLDIDTSNGVQTCYTALRNGINQLDGATTIEAGSEDQIKVSLGIYFTRLFAGDAALKNLTNPGGIKKDETGWLKKLVDFRTKVQNARAKLDPPFETSIRNRGLSVVTACFTPMAKSNAFTSMKDWDFNINDTVYYFKASRDKIIGKSDDSGNLSGGSASSMLITGGQAGSGPFSHGDRDVYIGSNGGGDDLALGFSIGNESTITLTGGDSSYSFGSKFWPIGADSPLVSSYPGVKPSNTSEKDGLVSCKWVKDNAKFLLSNIRANSSNELEHLDGTPLTPEEKAAVTTDYSVDGSAAANIDINCDWDIFNPLTWFLCPIVEGGAQVITKLDAEINQQLTIRVDEGSNFDESQGNGVGLYSAWSSMRTIALSLLVIIALVMVISQALSIGPFDAYTVKKVLPRIVASVIFITLSWQICKFLIGISNDFGQGVGAILARPFANIGSNPTVDVSGGTNNAIGTIGTIAGLFSGLDLLAVGSFLLVGIAAVFIALVVIAFRSILATLLVMTAPLALIFWILPNTQKVWKIWKDNFTAILVSFPIIVGFLTSGRIFSKIAHNSGNSLFYNIIVFIAYFGPYFALPFAFRLAGGAIASIGGLANDRGKGFFDRNRKFRQNRMGHQREQRASGNMFKSAPKGSIRSALNRGYQLGANANQAGLNPLRMRRRMQAALAIKGYNEAKEVMEKNQDFAMIKGNEDFLEAGRQANDVVRDKFGNVFRVNGQQVKRDGSRAAARAYLEARGYEGRHLGEAVEALSQVKNNVSQEAFNLAAVLATPSTGTGFASGAGEMDRAIDDATEGDTLVASRMLAEMRGSAANARRPDLAGGGYGARLEAFKFVRNAVMNQGSDAGSIQAAMDNVTQRIDRETLRTQGAGAIATMKAAQLEDRMTPLMLSDLQTAASSSGKNSDVNFMREVAAIQKTHDVVNQINPENAEILANKVLGQRISIDSLSPEVRTLLSPVISSNTRDLSVQQIGEFLQTNNRFREAYKAYGSGQEASSQQRPPDASPGAILPPPGAN